VKHIETATYENFLLHTGLEGILGFQTGYLNRLIDLILWWH